MTDDEAAKVAGILTQADGGSCSSCASGLVLLFNAAFPGHEPQLDAAWRAEFGEYEARGDESSWRDYS